jgi:hypothetical protein
MPRRAALSDGANRVALLKHAQWQGYISLVTSCHPASLRLNINAHAPASLSSGIKQPRSATWMALLCRRGLALLKPALR